MKQGIGKMEAFPSIWGHWAGGPGDSKEDLKWLDDHLREFLGTTAPDSLEQRLQEAKIE